MRDATYVILGKRWRLRYVARMRDHGECDRPDAKAKEIRLAAKLKRRPAALLETLIHEALHAADFTRDCDEWVHPVARDIARILVDQGFRMKE